MSDDQMPADVRTRYRCYRTVRLLLKPVSLVLAVFVAYMALQHLPWAAELVGPPTLTNVAIVIVVYGVVLTVIRTLLRRDLRRTADRQIAAQAAAVGGAASAGAWFYMLSADLGMGSSWMGGHGIGHGGGDYGGGGIDGGGFDGGGGGGE